MLGISDGVMVPPKTMSMLLMVEIMLFSYDSVNITPSSTSCSRVPESSSVRVKYT